MLKFMLLGAGLALLVATAMPVTANVASRDVTEGPSSNASPGHPPAPLGVAAPFGGGDRLNAGFQGYSGAGGAYLVEGHIPTIPFEGWGDCVGCHNDAEQSHARVLAAQADPGPLCFNAGCHFRPTRGGSLDDSELTP